MTMQHACRRTKSVQKENMELDKACHSLPADIDTNGVVRSSRDLPPAHYTFQIKNFSVLFEAEVEKCESGQFEVGGYKWRLVLKTNGKKNSKSQISLNLAIENQNTLSLGWEVNVKFRFFVFDQIRNKYLCIQDGIVRRFHNLKTEWGFPQLLSHDTLNDPSNGYIVDDSCILGAEVLVIKRTGSGVCLSMIKQPQTNYFTWRVDNFDARKDHFYVSNVFVVEGRKWKLLLYPTGNMTKTGTDGFLSLYLQTADDSEIITPNRKLYAKYKLRLRDQVNSNHLEKTFEYWFDSNYLGFGSHTFSSLMRDVKDPSNGYLVDDALLVECKIDVISVVKDFSG